MIATLNSHLDLRKKKSNQHFKVEIMHQLSI